MKSKILICVAASALSLATTNAAIISVNFAGRADGSTNGVGNSGGVIAAGDAAGVMNVNNFNNILRSTYSPPDNGQGGVTFTSSPMNDSTGTATPVTFNINATDSWNSETGNSSSNHTLLNGIIKANATQSIVPLNILNLGVGTPYTLQVYTMENRKDAQDLGGQYSITDGTSTFFQTSQIGQNFNGSFIKGVNTDTAGGRPQANYVEFSGTVGANGQINVLYKYEAGSDGTGIAGFQLETIPEPSSLLLLGFASAGMFIRRRR